MISSLYPVSTFVQQKKLILSVKNPLKAMGLFSAQPEPKPGLPLEINLLAMSMVNWRLQLLPHVALETSVITVPLG